jgi:hypothetical protein
MVMDDDDPNGDDEDDGDEFPRRVDVRQAAGRKNNCRINMMKNMWNRPCLVWERV